jgi:hypothetical protein
MLKILLFFIMNYPADPINQDRVSILILLKDTESFFIGHSRGSGNPDSGYHDLVGIPEWHVFTL